VLPLLWHAAAVEASAGVDVTSLHIYIYTIIQKKEFNK
jgi:hypothetical protein